MTVYETGKEWFKVVNFAIANACGRHHNCGSWLYIQHRMSMESSKRSKNTTILDLQEFAEQRQIARSNRRRGFIYDSNNQYSAF